MVVLAAALLASLAALGGAPAIVPIPASMQAGDGAFDVSAATPIVAGAHARGAAEVLARWIERSHGLRLRVAEGPARHGAIALRIDRDAGLAAEAYRLEVGRDGVLLVASTSEGLVRGAATLWQLLGRAPGASIPAVRIEDAPRFAWRGVMLDSARHFQSPQFILRFLDAMALQKLNVLHWHLTDDQAWRLEIAKYPRLASVGAWRVPAGHAAQADIDPATRAPRRYGGFYSRADVRRIVAYAARLGITVIPEIEMPGHASAAIAAYPRLAAGGDAPREVPADWGIYANVYSLDEATFGFLEDVLVEVMELFPSRYIHVGGDEVDPSRWKESARGRAILREMGSDDASKLQARFTERMARFLASHGRRLVGWDEILEPELPRSSVVMSWRGIDGALKAAEAGYDTVLAAHPVLYFDNRQAAAASEPPGRARVVSLEDVYGFEPMPPQLSAEARAHVLGVQANVWTEHIRTEERVGWMTFPRAAAVAELGWSQPARRDWAGFRTRIAALPRFYDALGMTYAKSAFETPAPAPEGRITSQDLKLCSDDIALSLEDDAPVKGPRAVFLVDIQNPCWIAPRVDLDRVRWLAASVGQVPFNFQIGEAIHKIKFPAPETKEGELVVREDTCEGRELARLPLAPATGSDAVTRLPRAALAEAHGVHDLCLRFAQARVDPMWVIDAIEPGSAP